MRIKITWEVDDGYAGKYRPQYTYIEEEDWLAAKKAGPAAVERLIEESVQKDFNNSISWGICGEPEEV